jgi:hypothetical protein
MVVPCLKVSTLKSESMNSKEEGAPANRSPHDANANEIDADD